MTFQVKLDIQTFLVKLFILFLFFLMIDNCNWTWTENNYDKVFLMMYQSYILEESLFLPCVSDLPGNDINKIVIYADNTYYLCILKESLFLPVLFDVSRSVAQVALDLSKSIIILSTLPVKNLGLIKTPWNCTGKQKRGQIYAFKEFNKLIIFKFLNYITDINQVPFLLIINLSTPTNISPVLKWEKMYKIFFTFET